MSSNKNKESLDQIKNVGLTRKFCVESILDPEFPLELKSELLNTFVEIHLTFKKKITTYDDLSYSFEKINEVKLTERMLNIMNVNEIKQGFDIGEDIIILSNQLLNG